MSSTRLITSTIYVCLLVFCASAAAGESGVDKQSSDKAATGTADEAKKTGQEEDILDRVFSPLDKAVSDINRDLNEGDGGTTAEARE